MRIALLHYTCSPIVGGVERVLAEQARLLVEHGHLVTVIAGAGEQQALAGSAPRADLRLVLLPELRAEFTQPVAPQTASALADRLRPFLEAQELVLLHNVLCMPFNLALTEALWLLAEQLPAVRFIGWIHDLAAVNPDYRTRFQSLDPALDLLRKAHARIEYVAVSDVRRTQFCKLTGRRECRVVPNGLDVAAQLRLPPLVQRIAEEWQLLQRPLVLLHPARLLPRKNVEATLAVAAAFCDLAHAGLPPVVVLTGAGDPHQLSSLQYAGSLREKAHDLGVQANVCWASDYGAIDDAELSGLYAVADALFLPSLQEGFGLPIVEAALHRLPIFCLDCEPMRSLLPLGAVTVFAAETAPQEIAREIMRQTMASQAIHNRKAAVLQYSWPAIYEKFLAPLLAGSDTPHSS